MVGIAVPGITVSPPSVPLTGVFPPPPLLPVTVYVYFTSGAFALPPVVSSTLYIFISLVNLILLGEPVAGFNCFVVSAAMALPANATVMADTAAKVIILFNIIYYPFLLQ